MRNPRPGVPVRGSKTGRPIMAALDLLGRRWALRITWELRENSLNFRELRAACGNISPSVLNQRLSELREAGIVEPGKNGYELTPEGRKLRDALVPLWEWSVRWEKRSRRR